MYLKSIDLQGFKSFVKRTKLEFGPGLTGIVGPNGSGKSNIADAVRWVLGEQSARQLRGLNMQDVIFAGTENKRSVSYAYVCLKFDNTDGALKDAPAEISVTRRVYRSGESEYLMNDTPCRMRDIVELFYDTGIGREGYSIIGQGQVEKILNGKPEDRREMFDEAAGIMRFRKRREASRKRLESEQASLLRVNDIISELEKQVSPLEGQARKAQEYIKLKGELKDYDIQNFLTEALSYEEELKNIEENLKNNEEELESAKETSLRLRESHTKAQESLSEADRNLDELKSERDDTSTRRESLDGDLRLLKEQIRSGETSVLQLASRKEAIEMRRAQLKEEQENFQEEKGKLNERIDELDDRLSAAKDKFAEGEKTLEKLRFSADKMQKQVIEIMSRKAEVGAQRQHFDTLKQQTLERKNRLDDDIDICDRQLLKEKEDLTKCQEKLDNLNDSLEKILKASDKNANDIDSYSNKVQELNDRHLDAVNRSNTCRITFENLQNLAERYEGFNLGVKNLMEARDKFPGVIGTVTDLIATEKKYETAIEAALGGLVQNIVTDSEATAKACVEYLKRGKHGRSTFLPLDSIKAKNLSHRDALTEKGVIGRASDLVKIGSKYKVLAEYLLGNVIVAEDINSALNLARKFKYDIRIATLEGEMLNRGGSVTGGTYKKSSNLLGRNREIDELKKAFEKAEAERMEVDKLLSEAKELYQTAKKERAELGIKREELERDKISFTSELSSVSKKCDEISERRQSLESERLILTGKLEEIESQGGQIENNVKKSDDERERLEKEIVSLHKKIEAQEVECEKLRVKQEELAVEFNNISQRDSFVLENLIRIGDELSSAISQENELTVEAGTFEQSAKERIEKISSLESLIRQTEDKLKDLDERIEKVSEDRARISEDQKKFLDDRENISDNIAQLSQEKLTLELKKNKIEEKYERDTNYLWDEYELTPSQVADIKICDELKPSELKKKIQKLKSDIRNLGPVNVNAIEDFVEVSERYHFMKNQREDLLKAEEALKSVIEELDSGMRKQFSEKFEKIRVEFNKVFKELFGGGMATMELVDSDDVLDAGIQIIVQPPGKKLSNLMQMSGGEKALTAISILFAIQNLKPSPFCLLDEIEASLDDPNVDRFAQYLNKLSDRSQFIIITHRRGTMGAADRLYGVTMQEKGVSTLVSVDITE